MRPSNNDSVAEGNIKDNRDDSDADGDHIRKNSTWDYRIRRASCLAFATGCLWILLFPLVTITTGEAKPRGTFFDENAMLVHHTMVKLTPEDVAWAQPAELRQTYSKVTMASPPVFHCSINIKDYYLLPAVLITKFWRGKYMCWSCSVGNTKYVRLLLLLIPARRGNAQSVIFSPVTG